MVLFSAFGNVDAPTPHGGPAFQGWKQGFGFGKAPGPGGHVMAPNMPMQLRDTPGGDRCFASTPFWRKKYEVGKAASFGFGDRPTYGKSEKDGSVAPNNYGDVSKQVGNTKDQVLRAGITIHPRFPSMEERYRDLSWPKCGPGPGKYDTRVPAGQGSWFNPVANPSWSMQSRPMLDGDVRAAMGRPGPGDYEARIDPGVNSSIRKGTLYDIKIKGRYPYNDIPGAISPGPARYNHKEGFDSKGLLQKIKNVPVNPGQPLDRSQPPWRSHTPWPEYVEESLRPSPKAREPLYPSMPQPDGMEEDEQQPESTLHEARRSGERGRQGAPSKHMGKSNTKRTLPRIESSPAAL